MLLSIGVAIILALGLRFGLDEVRAAFGALRPGYLALYWVAAVTAFVGYGSRWYLLSRAFGVTAPLLRMVMARVAGDAVGSLMPGARLAGDPVRAVLVHGEGLGGAQATAGVAVDRMVELVGNVVCATTYVAIFSLSVTGGLARGPETTLAGVLLCLMAALAVPVVMLRRGVRPFGFLYGWGRGRDRLRGWRRLLCDTEEHLATFFQARPGWFVCGVGASVLIEAFVILEYHLLLRAFGIDLGLPTLLMVLVASGMARAVPTPAGLGALELGQVTVLALAGGQAELGFVVGLVIRFHETLWMAIGFLILAVRGLPLARLRLLAAGRPAV